MAQSVQIKKVNSWHQALAAWLIANPVAKQSEAATHFGVTQAWLSTVINSDAFRDYFQQLQAEHTSSLLAPVVEKVRAAADQAVSEIQNRMNIDITKFSTKDLLEVSDVMLKRSGYGDPGARAAPQAPTVNNVFVVSRETLEESRRAMRSHKPAPPLALQAQDTSPANESPYLDLQALPGDGKDG